MTTDVNYSIPSIEATTPRRVWTSIKQIPQKKHLPPSHSGTYLRAAVASDGINEFKNESVQKTKKNHVNNPTINMQTSPEEKGLEHHGFFPNEGWVDSGSSKNCKSEKDEQNSVGFNQINRSLGVVELIAIEDSDSDSDTSDNRLVQIFIT